MASHTADDIINLSTQATWGSLHPNNVSASSYTPRMSSSVSVGLAALQALLGVFVTKTFLIRQLSGMDGNCGFPTISFVIRFTVGITCILVAYAHQVYVVDGKFSKTFIGIVSAIVVNFIPRIIFAACV
ncbi:hypothetical protein GGI19_006647 [Coemansia pectinata]|uniref:Uncharacterized protein n=1 Tax=Coemansia pectinata TaxID=1052879 RepID=A0A9W8L7C8_9FUNG|nr:hypothetical protein GGI19_006647 [Coemansia pectinata]